MGANGGPAARPYWHVDAKWISGLLLVAVLGVTLFVYTLVQVTAEKPAVDALIMTLALSLSRNGLDDATEIATVRERFRTNPGQPFQPIPGLRLQIKEEDLAGQSPRQARLSLFRQVAEPLYREGPQGLAKLADDPQIKESITQGVGPLGVLSLKTHQDLQRILTTLAIACLVLLISLVFFSYRFGRLFSPGLVLFLASLPGVLLFGLLRSMPEAETSAPFTPTSTQEMVGFLASGVLPPLARIAYDGYSTFVLGGFLLMVLATAIRILWWLSHRGGSAWTEPVGGARPTAGPAV